jgi:hypothetical protein
LTLPRADAQAGQLLERLGFAEDDRAAVLEEWPSPERDGELWRELETAQRLVVQGLGGFEPLRLPAAPGASRFFWVYVFLGALDAVRAWHAERGIPAEVSWATLADLGRNVALYRRFHDRPGFDEEGWMLRHFRGGLYQLGRLQFDRGRPTLDAGALAAAGAPFTQGSLVLDVHIPETGPLTPQACDESFRAAGEFFSRFFPEEPYRFTVCNSWLLDEQLAEYLDPGSNIVRFQQRFRLLPGTEVGDEDVVGFVFRRKFAARAGLDELPQRTRLERAVVTHLQAGRHWYLRSGWTAL